MVGVVTALLVEVSRVGFSLLVGEAVKTLSSVVSLLAEVWSSIKVSVPAVKVLLSMEILTEVGLSLTNVSAAAPAATAHQAAHMHAHSICMTASRTRARVHARSRPFPFVCSAK